MTETLPQALARQARTRPDQVALTWAADGTWSQWTYAELAHDVACRAAALRDQGVEPGTRVLVVIPPGPAFYQRVLALLHVGATVVLADPGSGWGAFLDGVAHVKPRALVGIWAARAASWLVPALGTVRVRCDPAPAAEPVPAHPGDPADTALIVFTTGSTGAPKPVPWTHAMMAAQVRAGAAAWGAQPGDIEVPCFSLMALLSLAHGLTVALPDSNLSRPARADVAAIADAVLHHGAQQLAGSPGVLGPLARHCQSQGLSLPTLDRVLAFGAPVLPDLHARWAELLRPDAQLISAYGVTEGLPLLGIGSHQVLSETAEGTRQGAGLCLGRPLPGTLARVHDGELVVRGPQVSERYVDRPDHDAANKLTLDGDIWHRTGDGAVVDDQGRFWGTGRLGHRLEVGAVQVDPLPLEAMLTADPSVRRCAVIADGPDQLVALVEVEPGYTLDPEGLRALLRPHPHGGLVGRLMPHPGLPLDTRHAAKIKRGELRAPAQGGA